MTLWIKICANTSLADAQMAAEAGADAVGFVFAPSPRRVTPAQVAAIVPYLPPTLEKIGVFVDASFAEIVSTVETCLLTGVQLHFDAPPALPAQLRVRFGPALRIVRTVHFDLLQSGDAKGRGISPYMSSPEPPGALAPEACFSDPKIDAFLIDSRTGTATGGTGIAFDWDLAATTLFQIANARKCIAAGGLTPENVADAVATLRPWGVDVVSGVESAPGRKDPAKVRAFIANARAAAGQHLTRNLRS
jgi:phosphoribosylanthranilate isomerase